MVLEASLHTQMTCGWCDRAIPWDGVDCTRSTPLLLLYRSTDYIESGRVAPGTPLDRGAGTEETGDGEQPRLECILVLAVAGPINRRYYYEYATICVVL